MKFDKCWGAHWASQSIVNNSKMKQKWASRLSSGTPDVPELKRYAHFFFRFAVIYYTLENRVSESIVNNSKLKKKWASRLSSGTSGVPELKREAHFCFLLLLFTILLALPMTPNWLNFIKFGRHGWPQSIANNSKQEKKWASRSSSGTPDAPELKREAHFLFSLLLFTILSETRCSKVK